MTKPKSVRVHDLVQVRDDPELPENIRSKRGVVTEVLRANRGYERRAIVRINDAYRPMIAIRFLDVIDR